MAAGERRPPPPEPQPPKQLEPSELRRLPLRSRHPSSRHPSLPATAVRAGVLARPMTPDARDGRASTPCGVVMSRVGM